MGGLRYKEEESESFLANDNGQEVPPITFIRTLEIASKKFEENEEDLSNWFYQIFKPGSSLGGARPKANILDINRELWIAKFPSIKDEYDVGGFEKVLYDFASSCLIEVSESKVIKSSNLGHYKDE